MPDSVAPPPPPPPPPAAAGFPAPPPAPARRSGCLKWGLIGCAGLSVVLIAGLVFVGYRAKGLLGWALDKMGTQIVAACAPSVTAEEKAAFQDAYRDFARRAQSGKVKPDRIQAFQKQALAALGDGTVTSDELRDLTDLVKRE